MTYLFPARVLPVSWVHGCIEPPTKALYRYKTRVVQSTRPAWGGVFDTSAPVLGIHHTTTLKRVTWINSPLIHTTMCRAAGVQNNQVLSHMRTTLNETPQTGELSHGAWLSKTNRQVPVPSGYGYLTKERLAHIEVPKYLLSLTSTIPLVTK